MNKDNINLSVIILVYNTEEFLEQCFDSIINQTLNNIEIIAVDDESSDNSLEICKEYEFKYDNFRVITQKNQGGAVAGTTGMKEAKGKYIALVDSDDFLSLDAYQILFDLCERYNADLATGKPLRYINKKEYEVILTEEKSVWEHEKVISSALDIKNMFHDKFYWNKIFKREFVEKYNIYMPDGYLYADFLMTHRAFIYAKKIVISPKVVYYWRRHSSSRVVKSASQEIASSENFKERCRSLIYKQTDNFKFNNKIDELRILLLSFVFKDIIYQKQFRDTFIEESQKVLNIVNDVESHDIHPVIKLKIWLLKENRLEELFFILGRGVKIKLKVVDEKVCCMLPFLLNDSINIPNEVYEYKSFRKEFIKNFLYIDYGKTILFQVLIHYSTYLKNSNYSIYFKDNLGNTKHKYKLERNGDYYSCIIDKKDIFKDYEILFLAIGNSDNRIYNVSISNCEPAFNLNKKLDYILHYGGKQKNLYIQKRVFKETVIKIVKRLLKIKK